MEVSSIYITCTSMDEATTIARALLDERLVACANLIPNVTSLYWYDDKIQQEREVVMFCKAPSKNIERISKTVQGIHKHDTPCVVALPIEDGNPSYLDWVEEETR